MNTNLQLLESPSWNYQQTSDQSGSRKSRIPTWESEDGHFHRYAIPSSNGNCKAAQSAQTLEKVTRMAVVSTIGACGLSLVIGLNIVQQRYLSGEDLAALANRAQIFTQISQSPMTPRGRLAHPKK